MTGNCTKRLGWAVLLIPSLALADSGVGVDTWRANKLDPTGGLLSELCDPAGTSWLVPLQRRTPTGNLYDCPPEPALLHFIGEEWRQYGILELGYVHTGDDRFALWNRYTDWKANNAVLGLLDLHFENPYTGEYGEVRGSRLSDDDQYYQAVFGEAGAYKLQAFFREMPNVLSTDARPIWNGVGTSTLTLPASLAPGLSTAAQVAAVSAATPVQTLKVVRRKEGLDVSGYLTPQWTAYLAVSHESRTGARPYGGPFGEDWPPNPGAVLETVKPIDDYTINLNAGFRYAGDLWRADFGYSGSYYRDRYLSYSFQQPFNIPTVVPVPAGAIVPPLTVGQMSMEPDNDYHNVHATVTRVTPLNGELSLSVSEVLMEQRDALIAPTNCQGYLGFGVPANGTQLTPQDVGPQNPNLVSCAQWNTTAALLAQKADVNMHNTLAQIGLVLRPRGDLMFDGGFKFYRQAYYNDYLAYNPQNNDYGYILENGAFEHAFGAPASFASGAFPPGPPPFNGRVGPFLLSLTDYNVHGGVTWHLTEQDSVGALYTFDEYKPTGRERDYVDNNSLKLTWVDKTLDWLTFRASYTYLRQTGSVYDTDVYGYAFLQSVPGFQQAYPTFVPAPETVAQLRKYDIGDRTQNQVNLMATLAAREDLTVTASFRGNWNSYPTLIGRQGYDTLASQISTEWTPTTTDSASAYIGYDQSRLSMASVAGQGGTQCPDLGCPFYANEYRWWASDHEHNYSAGLTLRHRIDWATIDLAYSYIYSRGLLDYSAASPLALVYPETFPTIGSGFPALTYRVSSATLGVRFDLSQRIALRVFDTYEIGRIADWHYDGFNQGLVVNNTVYTDAGPQSYSENLIGVMVQVKL
jgi:hypothetical protein